jgi:hypothetical protein
MKRVSFYAATSAAAAMIAAFPAAAVQPAPIPAREAVEQMCSAAGTAGHAFGSTGVPHSSRVENMLSPGRRVAERFAPFEMVQLQATPWSDRFAAATYEVTTLDAARAAALTEALSQAFEAAGWRRRPELEQIGDMPLYLVALSGDRMYELPGATPVLVGFGPGLGGFTLACGRKDLMLANAEETFGQLPPGTPRPQPPVLPSVTGRSPADCDRPEVQRELLTIIDGRANNPIALLLSRANYAERLAQWKKWRLTSSGRVSDERMMDILFGGLESGSPGGDPMAAFSLLSPMLDALQRLADEAEAGRSADACRTSLVLVGIFERMEAASAAQWRGIDAAIEAEARRVGVSLD